MLQLRTIGGGGSRGDLTTPRPTRRPAKEKGMSASILASGLNNLPAYVDKESIRKSLTRQKRDSVSQAHLVRMKNQVTTEYYNGRYKTAFKAATMAMKPDPDHTNFGKAGTDYIETVKRINLQMLNSPNDRKLKKSTIFNAVARGDFGVSPLKNGWRVSIPPS
jgi:hypothetical protein